MATLQRRGDSFRVLYLWHGKRRAFTIGKVEADEAEAKAAQVDYLLMRLRQRLLSLPDGCDIDTFLQFDGKPPLHNGNGAAEAKRNWLFGSLTDSYLETNAPSLELTTVNSIRLHFKHLTRTFGGRYPIAELTLAELQKHVDRRAKDRYRKRLINPATIRKEIVSLRTAWNWAVRMQYLSGRFPATGLRFPKTDERPPFMTRAEILRRIESGARAKELWDCLFLTVAEVQELLDHVKQHAQHGFLYPMFCLAAHTGARRSELLRAEIGDVDLIGETVLIRERKRVRGKRTTRRVPLSPFLAQVLKDWLATHAGGSNLFSQTTRMPRSRKPRTGPSPLTPCEAQHHFRRVLKRSQWQVLRGWHVLRHSFISACVMKGTDQRLIDAWVGHTTEEQRRRYTHLYPAVEQRAIRSVFG